MTTIFISDDEHITRLGLKLILSQKTELSLIGEANDGPETVRMVEQEKPNVLLLDLVLPSMMGFDVARQVRIVSSATKIIVLSSYDAQNYVSEALQAGVNGYVLKGSTPEILFEAIRTVMNGKRYLCPPFDQNVIDLPKPQRTDSNEPPKDLIDTLTKREKLVLQLAAEGINSTDIGSRLFISPRTAQTHRARLMRKLGLHSQTDLVMFAIRRGLLRPHGPKGRLNDTSPQVNETAMGK